jgi:hypothetical protein
MRRSLTLQRLITLVGAPVIWMAHFVICYIVVSLVCALQLTETRIVGMNPAQFGVAVATLLALLLMGGMAVVQFRKWRDPSGPDPELTRFFAANTLLLCGLSALALVWVAFPSVLLPACTA